MRKSSVRVVIVLAIVAVGAIVLAGSMCLGARTQKPTALQYHDTWRALWEDHINWTRSVIIGTLDSLPGTARYTARLLDNYDDMEDALRPYYGDDADELGDLIEEHLTIAVEILNAAKIGDQAALDDAKARWYANADEIAAMMAEMNPKRWKLDEAKEMWRLHLDATLEEAVAHLTADFDSEVEAFDIVHARALEMADFFSYGVIRQFPQRFRQVGIQ